MKSAVAALLLLPAIASAQPGVVEPAPMPRAIAVEVDAVDENVAAGLSLGGTVVSWGLLIAAGNMNNETMGTIGALGTLFAPSLGHWYSRALLTRGLGIRALGLGIGMVGLAMAFDNAFEESDRNNDGTAGALLLIGAGMYIAGTVDDIAMAPTAARRYNARFNDVMIVPQLNPHGGGLALLGRF
jgi:hypothetical protein